MAALDDMNFQIQYPDTDIEGYLENLITEDTLFIEIPDKIKEVLSQFNGYYIDLITTNFETLAEAFEAYFDTKADQLKADIEANLALDPNKIYDIKTTRCETADNALKFNNKTYNEVISDIIVNYVTKTTVNNSLKFNNKTQDEWENHIINDLVVKTAENANKAFGMDYDTLKSDIISSVEVESGNIDFEAIQEKVENEWIAYKAQDSIKFVGKSETDWKDIIKNTIVNKSLDTEAINGVSYDDLITSINNMINNHVSNAISEDNDDLISLIKNTKVKNAEYADTSGNSYKFSGMDQSDWSNYIQTSIKVDNASHADTADLFAGMSSEDFENRLTSLKNQIENDVENSLIAFKARTVLEINGVNVEDFDDHIRDIAAQVVSGDTKIDADTLQGNSLEDIYNYIKSNIKVDNAAHADSATYTENAVEASHASEADYALIGFKDPGYISGNIDFESFFGEKTFFKYLNISLINNLYRLDETAIQEGINLLAFNILKNFIIPVFMSNNDIKNHTDMYEYDENLEIYNFKQYSIPHPDSVNNSYKTQKFYYDDNGNISKIEYYNFFDELFYYEEYSYNTNGDISNIKSTLNINLILYKENIPEFDNNQYDIKFSYMIEITKTFTYDDNGNITQIDQNMTNLNIDIKEITE